MRSPSIERLHAKLDKQIRLLESYTEIKGLEFIIKACRLKPYSYIFEERDDKISLQRWWFDEFGNSLEFIKKKAVLTFNDLRLNRNKIICTDLYYGLSLDKVAKMSKLVYLVAGKDEDLYQDCFIITFLGIDNHLRTYLYWYGDWQKVSPLIIGMRDLKKLSDNLDIKYFHKIKNNSGIPCISSQAWISYLPPSQEFLDVIKNQCEILLPILK